MHAEPKTTHRLDRGAPRRAALLRVEAYPEALHRVALGLAPHPPVARQPVAAAVRNQAAARPQPAAEAREEVSDQLGPLRLVAKAAEALRQLAEAVEVAAVVVVRAEARA